jgi:hypothetical protein
VGATFLDRLPAGPAEFFPGRAGASRGIRERSLASGKLGAAADSARDRRTLPRRVGFFERRADSFLGFLRAYTPSRRSVMAVAPIRKLFTVSNYHAMSAAGILREEEPVELVMGKILVRPPIGMRHWTCVNRVNGIFAHLFAEKCAIVSIQNPLILGEISKPQPDVTLLRYREDFYTGTEVTAADVLLVV